MQSLVGPNKPLGKRTFGLNFGFPVVPQTRATGSLVLPQIPLWRAWPTDSSNRALPKLAPKSWAPPVWTKVKQPLEVVTQKQIPEIKEKTQGEARGPVRFHLLQRQWGWGLAGSMEAWSLQRLLWCQEHWPQHTSRVVAEYCDTVVALVGLKQQG